MATVLISNRTRRRVGEEKLRVFARRVLEATREWCDAELSITFVGDRRIQELNGKWRGKPRPTDVLSFPMESAPCGAAPLLMGDIIIAPGQALSDAREEGVTPETKFKELILHSILHLMGYDHERPVDAKKMEARRLAILSTLEKSE